MPSPTHARAAAPETSAARAAARPGDSLAPPPAAGPAAVLRLQRQVGNAAVGAMLGRAPAPPSVQRLVIRIRDMWEMAVPFTSNTIWDASKTMKNYPAFGNTARWKQDIGIKGALAEDHRKLDAAEPLVVVSHGGEPKAEKDGTISGKFGQRTPEELAADVHKIMPENYAGDIFLNGCYTGMRIGFAQAGSSFIERFGTELLKLRQYPGVIKGNIGPASTMSAAEELISIDKPTYDRWAERNPHGVATNKEGTKYYMRGPFGQARYRASDDTYNDMGYAAMLA